jgi:hypothetical protein
VADITEGTVFGLGIAQVIDLGSFGIASSAAVGIAKANATSFAGSVSSSAVVGTAKTNASVVPVGIDADNTVLGSPQLDASFTFTGISSGVQFGDADTVATVFIIPGPVDPSNDFGTVNVIREGWLFRPPVNTYQWRLFKEYEGVSLLREDGVWSEVQHPDLERTLAAQLYLAGGRDHFVDDTTRAELIALGYTVTEELIP